MSTGTIIHSSAGTTFTGEAITVLSLTALQGALRLEDRGFKRRGPSALSIAKRINKNKSNDRGLHRALLEVKKQFLMQNITTETQDEQA